MLFILNQHIFNKEDYISEPSTGSYVCNPNYSRSRDQEEHGTNPAQENSSGDFISKNTQHIKLLWGGSSNKSAYLESISISP
jgi:hypothetical protein